MSYETYHSVTTSLLYVFVGIDLARAKPVSIHSIKCAILQLTRITNFSAAQTVFLLVANNILSINF